MPGTKALQARKVVTRLESTTLWNSLSVKSVTDLRILMPAELIRICGFLNLALTSPASRLTSLSLVISAVKVSTVPPLAFSSPATLSSFAWLRPTSAMAAPAPDKVCAMASPRPPEPPTMIAVLPVRSIFTCETFFEKSALGVRFQEEPAESGHDRRSRHGVHHHRPVVVGVLQDFAEHHRGDEAGKIAQHVHGRGDGGSVLLADLHAGVPGNRHGQVACEAGQAHQRHRQHG